MWGEFRRGKRAWGRGAGGTPRGRYRSGSESRKGREERGRRREDGERKRGARKVGIGEVSEK